MAKGKESVQDSIRGVTQVIEAVEENPKRFKSISEIHDKLNEIKEEIEFQLLYWEGRAKRNIGFRNRLKARKKVRTLKTCRDELDYLFMRYESLVEIRSK